MTYSYLGKTMRYCGQLAMILGATALFGCEGEVVEAGEADDTSDDSGAESSGDTTEQTTTQVLDPDPSCATEDAETRANYDTWLGSENDFEDGDVSLLGRTFQGYIEGGADITLQIETDGSALFFAGDLVERPVTDKDKGYLCGAAESQEEKDMLCYAAPLESVPYVIRGASLSNQRLVVPLHETTPYDPWCAAQTPVLIDATDNECAYGLYPNTTMGWGAVCTIGEEVVDCGWMQTTGWTGPAPINPPCRCTSFACFAQIYPDAEIELDARVSDTPGEITGSVVVSGAATPVYLFEVNE